MSRRSARSAARSATRSASRPAGLARGAGAVAAAWVGGALIALLTGATAVVILLAVAVVGAIAAFVAGPLALRGTMVRELSTATVVTEGDELHWTVHLDAHIPVYAEVRLDGVEVAAGWLHDGHTVISGTAPRRGMYGRAEVRWRSAGRMGLLWWRRRLVVEIEPLAVGAAPASTPAPAERAA